MTVAGRQGGGVRPLIVCMGEMLVDLLPVTEAGQLVAFRPQPGGSLLNTAVAIARLGGRSALVTKAGSDFFGGFLRRYAEGEGIDTRWLTEAPAQTALGVVAVEDGEPVFTFYGDGTADSLLAADDLPAELYAETGILHVGSVSLLRGTTPATVVAACERLRGRALLSFDPNLRPSLVRDEPAYRATFERLLDLVDVLKVSAADLAWLAPGREVADFAVNVVGRGPAVVAVTRGAAGVLVARRTGSGPVTADVPGFEVAVADTVGAGDSFSGGLLTRLAELGVTSRPALEGLADGDLLAAVRFATAVAALDCTRPGADPPTRAEVDALVAGSIGSAT